MPKDDNKIVYVNLYGISEPEIGPFYKRPFFIILLSFVLLSLVALFFIIT